MYFTYQSLDLILCHISIYLRITALVDLCSCLINVHIYCISLKHSEKNAVSTRPWADVLTSACLVHGITQTAPLILVSSLLLLGFAETSLQLFQKVTKINAETQKRQWTKTFLIQWTSTSWGKPWLVAADIWNSCNEYQAKNPANAKHLDRTFSPENDGFWPLLEVALEAPRCSSQVLVSYNSNKITIARKQKKEANHPTCYIYDINITACDYPKAE